jgi:myo-inositol-1(or 4)-monophosphatase
LPVPDADTKADLALMEAAVREAGKIARSYFGGHYRSWDKGKGQPVTEADLAVDHFLRDTLTAARPDYGWLSEETEHDPRRLSAANTFVVDPIDGTVGFLKGRPQFTICAAVVHDGRATSGVIFNPMTEECFTAREGGGAHLNAQPIAVSARNAVEGCRMLAAKATIAHQAWSSTPSGPWPAMAVETRSSIAYRMALVAGGGYDAMLALSAKHDWDLAAGDVIVREAGGRVTDHLGAALCYNGAAPIQPSVVCAGPALHALLLDRLAHVPMPRH